MGTPRIWQRLLWKEACESWALLLVGVALPLALLRLPKDFAGAIVFSAICVVAILLVLWAAGRVHAEGQQARARIILPLTRTTRWLATYLLPLPVPAAIGLALGYTLWTFTLSTPQTATIMAVTLFTLALFFFTTALAATLSIIPAIITGVLLLFASSDFYTIHTRPSFFAAIIAGSLLAGGMRELTARHTWQWVGRIGAVLVLAGVTLSPLVYLAFASEDEAVGVAAAFEFCTADDTACVSYDPADPRRLSYRDMRHDGYRQRDFPLCPLPIAFVGNRDVIVGQQPPRATRLRLLVWDTTADQVREVANLPMGREVNAKRYTAFTSPEGQYLALTVKSRVGDGYDLWLMELPSWQATLVLPNLEASVEEGDLFYRASWTPDYLYLSGGIHAAVEVDLHQKCGRLLKLPPIR